MAEDLNKRPKVFFPRHIDSPKLIGVFEMDEFAVAAGVVVVIMTISLGFPDFSSLYTILLAVALGLGCSVLYSKFKGKNQNGYVRHKLYRMGIYAPQDDKKALLLYPHFKKIGNIVPYGFNKELFN